MSETFREAADRLVPGIFFPAPVIVAPVEQGAGYTGRWTHAPVDKYGAPIVPGDWPVNPRGRVA